MCAPLEHVLQLIGVVGLNEMREASGADRHPFAVGRNLGIADLRPFVHRRKPHRRVEQAVIAAFQNHVVVLPGVSASQTQTGHDGLSPRVREAHQFGRRHHFGNTFGHGEFALRRQRENAAHLHAETRRGIDPVIRVAQNGRAVTHPVVHVNVVVEVDDARTLAVFDIDRAVLAPIAEIGSHTQRQPLHGALEMRVVVGQFSGHGVPLTVLQGRDPTTLPRGSSRKFI